MTIFDHVFSFYFTLNHIEAEITCYTFLSSTKFSTVSVVYLTQLSDYWATLAW